MVLRYEPSDTGARIFRIEKMKDILISFIVGVPLVMLIFAWVCASLDFQKYRIPIVGGVFILALITFGVCGSTVFWYAK